MTNNRDDMKDVYCNNHGDCITAEPDCRVFEVYRTCPYEHHKSKDTLLGFTLLEIILLTIVFIGVVGGLFRDRG